jgi:hypothetical protein
LPHFNLLPIPKDKKTGGKIESGVNYYDDLTLNVNILYDDCQVLPDPSVSIDAILYPSEVDGLRAVHKILNPLLNDLGNKPDSDYLADLRWPAVIVAAKEALQTMRTNAAKGGTAAAGDAGVASTVGRGLAYENPTRSDDCLR